MHLRKVQYWKNRQLTVKYTPVYYTYSLYVYFVTPNSKQVKNLATRVLNYPNVWLLEQV